MHRRSAWKRNDYDGDGMNMKAWLLGMTLLGVGLGVGTWIGAANRPGPVVPSSSSTVALTVTVVNAEKRALSDAIRVVGATRSREDVVVIPELTGLRITRVDAEVGDVVRAGQTLALLDGESLGIQRDELRAELARTRGEYDRAKTLVATQLISREFFNQKQAAYEVARSRLENAGLNVQRTRIVAPASGLVFSRTAAIGGLTDGDKPLFEIAKDGVVEMEANVPEAIVGRLRTGMAASVEVAGRATPISGVIRLISPSVDSLSRAANVRIRLEAGEPLPVGAFSQARIDVAEVVGWAVPRSALQQDSSGSYVWRVDDKRMVKRHPVTATMQTPEMVIVAEALGDIRIVAKAGPFLRENDQVSVAKAGR